MEYQYVARHCHRATPASTRSLRLSRIVACEGQLVHRVRFVYSVQDVHGETFGHKIQLRHQTTDLADAFEGGSRRPVLRDRP